MKSVTTMRSRFRDKTGVMEIGRKSNGMSGTEIFATGRIDVDFHWLGTMEDDRGVYPIVGCTQPRTGGRLKFFYFLLLYFVKQQQAATLPNA